MRRAISCQAASPCRSPVSAGAPMRVATKRGDSAPWDLSGASATAQNSQSLGKFDPPHGQHVAFGRGAEHAHPRAEQSFAAPIHVQTPSAAVVPLQDQARSRAEEPSGFVMSAAHRHAGKSTQLLGSGNPLSSEPARPRTQEDENMQVQNDDCHMSLRSELQRVIIALEAQRLFQAAYAPWPRTASTACARAVVLSGRQT